MATTATRQKEEVQLNENRTESQIHPAVPTEEQIRDRAHEIWLRRGGQDGCETEDWLQAEKEIRAEAK